MLQASSRRLQHSLRESLSKLHGEYLNKTISQYTSNKAEVDRVLEPVLKSSPIVVFLEGTVDAPKSKLSSNLLEMIKETVQPDSASSLAQIPCKFQAVNVLQHPAIAGFAIQRSGSHSFPQVFVSGQFYGDHDRFVYKMKNGDVQKLKWT
jgi:glutaredoxin-related protein